MWGPTFCHLLVKKPIVAQIKYGPISSLMCILDCRKSAPLPLMPLFYIASDRVTANTVHRQEEEMFVADRKPDQKKQHVRSSNVHVRTTASRSPESRSPGVTSTWIPPPPPF